MNSVPRIYRYEMNCLFSDFDINGHLNSIRLLEMLMDSRHAYFLENFKKPISELAKEGFGLYTTKLSCNYRKSISESDKLIFESQANFCVAPVIGFSFKVITDSDNLVADGKFEQVVVNSKTGEPMEKLPEMLKYFFFKDGKII